MKAKAKQAVAMLLAFLIMFTVVSSVTVQTAEAATKPGVTSSLTVKKVSKSGNTYKLKATWKKVSKATKYKMTITAVDKAGNKSTSSSYTTSTSCTFKITEKNLKYVKVTIKAYNGSTASSSSKSAYYYP